MTTQDPLFYTTIHVKTSIIMFITIDGEFIYVDFVINDEKEW
ncbi:MAG: hypothetical protein MjAS7_2289 [Metallosphaera javensis (ex Sakai et al. 2022)]|nr:MAG: hypothetical protein MjAS7_2289 [Metallosphaera javensis (ex Sakai et al. 2022)]